MAKLSDPLANKIFTVLTLHKTMADNYDKAIAAIADPKTSVDSFRIEDLTTATAERQVWGWIDRWKIRVEPFITRAETGRFVDYNKDHREDIETALDNLEAIAKDSVLSFHLPNSTSNISVEMSLREHNAWLKLYKALTGRF